MHKCDGRRLSISSYRRNLSFPAGQHEQGQQDLARYRLQSSARHPGGGFIGRSVSS